MRLKPKGRWLFIKANPQFQQIFNIMKLTNKNRKLALEKFNSFLPQVESLANKAKGDGCPEYIKNEFNNMFEILKSNEIIYASCFQSRFDNWKMNAGRMIRGEIASVRKVGNGYEFKLN